jgi:hypothetical protein
MAGSRELYVIRKEVKVSGIKVFRYRIFDPVTNETARDTPGYKGRPSDKYETQSEAEAEAKRLNKLWKRK